MKLKKWQYVVSVLCIILMYCNKWFPTLGSLSRVGTSTVYIFVATMVMLILVDICWPVILCIGAFAFSDVYSVSTAIQLSLGNNIFWFVIFCTMILAVLNRCGVLKRMAVWMVTRPITKKNPWYLIGMIFLGELLLGLFMNCTVIILLFCGLTEQIFEALEIKKGDKMAELVMMGELLYCGLSYGISPIGHPVGILGIQMFEPLQQVSYVQFLGLGLLIAAGFFIIHMAVMRFVFKVDVSVLSKFDVDTLKTDEGPLSKEAKFSVAVFVFVVLWWVLPSLIQNALPSAYAIMNKLGYVFPCIVAIILMCLVPIKGEPLMDITKSLKNDASWPGAFPMAAAMILSDALTNEDAGITEFVSDLLGPLFGSMPGILFVIIMCLICCIMTNVSSDTVSVMLCGTIAVTLMQSGVIHGVNAGAMCVALSNCACCAYATPAGSTYGALVSGMGWVKRGTQFVHGFAFALLVAALSVVLGYGVGCLIF